MSALAVFLSQAILYAPGPFFAWPWKPFVNHSSFGSSYSVGYKHFWLDHQDFWNLVWHVICLFFQISSNFSLLAVLDESIGYKVILPTTAMIWVMYLCFAQHSIVFAKISSFLTIAGVYFLTPTLIEAMGQIEFYVYGAFAVVWGLKILFKGTREGSWKESATYLAFLGVKYIITQWLLSSDYNGILADYTIQISALYIVLLSGFAMQPDPVKKVVPTGSLVSHVLSILTAKRGWFLHSCAFTAMVLQGLSHSLSGEQATILKLQALTNQEAKVAYEWSHVTYFPNLLFHAVFDSFNIKGRRKNF